MAFKSDKQRKAVMSKLAGQVKNSFKNYAKEYKASQFKTIVKQDKKDFDAIEKALKENMKKEAKTKIDKLDTNVRDYLSKDVLEFAGYQTSKKE